MRKRKNASITALIGAMAEAESKAYYDEQDTLLNDLDQLLNTFLQKDSTPERKQLLK